MKKFAWLALFSATFLIAPSLATAQLRSTSFDDRPTCMENKGVWREFGNGCGDNCESKFDQYEICTTALTYACDCGKGRCWHEDKCMSMTAYKIIFDKKAEENEKFLAQKARERSERIKNDPDLDNYMHNLYVRKDAATVNGGVSPAGGTAGVGTGAGVSGVPLSQTQAQQQAQAQAIKNQQQQNSQQALIATDPSAAGAPPVNPTTQLVITPANPNQTAGQQQQQVPALFAQQQAQKEEAQKQAAQAAAPTAAGNNGLPALPVIPLP